MAFESRLAMISVPKSQFFGSAASQGIQQPPYPIIRPKSHQTIPDDVSNSTRGAAAVASMAFYTAASANNFSPGVMAGALKAAAAAGAVAVQEAISRAPPPMPPGPEPRSSTNMPSPEMGLRPAAAEPATPIKPSRSKNRSSDRPSQAKDQQSSDATKKRRSDAARLEGNSTDVDFKPDADAAPSTPVTEIYTAMDNLPDQHIFAACLRRKLPIHGHKETVQARLATARAQELRAAVSRKSATARAKGTKSSKESSAADCYEKTKRPRTRSMGKSKTQTYDAPPDVSELSRCRLPDLRKFIRVNGLVVKTTGSGRTIEAIRADILKAVRS